eukprot:6207992-Pleurochrysis_carterae.AAC.1
MRLRRWRAHASAAHASVASACAQCAVFLCSAMASASLYTCVDTRKRSSCTDARLIMNWARDPLGSGQRAGPRPHAPSPAISRHSSHMAIFSCGHAGTQGSASRPTHGRECAMPLLHMRMISAENLEYSAQGRGR